jgi:3-oxoacyl-[acyl-carrier-protein] synthase III
MRGAITGWGKCLPPAVLTNQDIAGFLDTDDEWIRTRTGIHERRVSHVGVSQLGAVAGARAMACAGVGPADIDAVILATTSPEILIPSTASLVQNALNIPGAAAFDVNAGCTGFMYALATANGLIASGVHQRILLIGAERLTFYLDWRDRNTAVLFGDGAGAVVLEATDDGSGVLASSLHCDADAGEILMIPDFGTVMDMTKQPEPLRLQFDGREIFKRAVKGMAGCLQEAAERASVSLTDCDQLIPHQANQRIIEALGKQLQLRPEQVMSNVSFYGNTSSATVPIALCEALEQGRLKPGATVFMTAFGAGLTRAATVVRWGERVKPLGTSNAELPPCEFTALELITPMLEYQQGFPAPDQ